VGPLRGNVHSRLRKVDCGEIDATILGFAGLKRLGLAASAMQALSTDDFLPAVGQGAVAIETRDDEKTRELLAAIDHAPTAIAVTAERAFLSVLDGPCRTPIASYAVALGGDIEFRGVVLSPDGTKAFETRRSQPVSYATILCADAGAELKGRASARLIIQAG
jgi:hydroxymethylbilane synthase